MNPVDRKLTFLTYSIKFFRRTGFDNLQYIIIYRPCFKICRTLKNLIYFLNKNVFFRE